MVKESTTARFRAMKTPSFHRLPLRTLLCILWLHSVRGLSDVSKFRIGGDRGRSLQGTTSAPTIDNNSFEEANSTSPTPAPSTSQPSVEVQSNNGSTTAPTVATTSEQPTDGSGGESSEVVDDDPGVDETFLERRWDIPHPIAHYDEYALTLEYRVSTYIENHMAEITLYDSSSCFEGTLVEPPVSREISNNDYLSYLRTNQPSVQNGDDTNNNNSSPANLPPGTRQINLTLTIEPDKIQNSPIFLDNGDHHEIQFCVRIGLSTRDTSVEINNKETMVKLELDQHDTIDKVALYQKNVIDEDSKELFSAEAFRCNDNNMQLALDAPPLMHGESVRICVRPTAAAIRNTATIGVINYFNFQRDDLEQSAIEDGGREASDGLTIFTCAPGSSICAFTTLLNAEFYTYTGVVHGEGEVILQYVVLPDSRVRRRRLQLRWASSFQTTRQTQESSLGGTPILIDIPVEGTLGEEVDTTDGNEKLTNAGDADLLDVGNNNTNSTAGTDGGEPVNSRPLYLKVLVVLGIIAIGLCSWDTLFNLLSSSEAKDDDGKTTTHGKDGKSTRRGENEGKESSSMSGIFQSTRSVVFPSPEEPPEDDGPDVFIDEDVPLPPTSTSSENKRQSSRKPSSRRAGSGRSPKRGTSTEAESSRQPQSSRNSDRSPRRSPRRDGDGQDKQQRRRNQKSSRSRVQTKTSAEWGDLEVPCVGSPVADQEGAPRRTSKR